MEGLIWGSSPDIDNEGFVCPQGSVIATKLSVVLREDRLIIARGY